MPADENQSITFFVLYVSQSALADLDLRVHVIYSDGILVGDNGEIKEIIETVIYHMLS